MRVNSSNASLNLAASPQKKNIIIDDKNKFILIEPKGIDIGQTKLKIDQIK